MTVEQALAELNRQAANAHRHLFGERVDPRAAAEMGGRYNALLDAIEVVRRIHAEEQA